ncbi:MAG: rod-binding protein [Novosphingobium sp.]
MSTIAPLPASSAAKAAAAPQREDLRKAARQFEAIFVRQMLAEARKSSFDNGLFSGEGLDTFRQMQDERFADIAAERGAFGMARLIEAQLAAQMPATEAK